MGSCLSEVREPEGGGWPEREENTEKLYKHPQKPCLDALGFPDCFLALLALALVSLAASRLVDGK